METLDPAFRNLWLSGFGVEIDQKPENCYDDG